MQQYKGVEERAKGKAKTRSVILKGTNASNFWWNRTIITLLQSLGFDPGPSLPERWMGRLVQCGAIYIYA